MRIHGEEVILTGDPRKDRYLLPILETCENLHNHCTYASDPMPPNDALFCHEFLKMRLGTWQPSHKRGQLDESKFDKVVQDLIVATLEMYESGSEQEDRKLANHYDR